MATNPHDPGTRQLFPAPDLSRAVLFIVDALHLCERFSGSITSYYRTPQRNAQVGGAQRSKHLTATAVDVVLDNPALYTEAKRAAELAGLVAIIEADHLHIHRAD